MPFTQVDLDNLDRAIADGRGARSMTFDNQSVTFNSIDDMLKLRGRMQAEITGVAGTRVGYRVATTTKGV